MIFLDVFDPLIELKTRQVKTKLYNTYASCVNTYYSFIGDLGEEASFYAGISAGSKECAYINYAAWHYR